LDEGIRYDNAGDLTRAWHYFKAAEKIFPDSKAVKIFLENWGMKNQNNKLLILTGNPEL